VSEPEQIAVPAKPKKIRPEGVVFIVAVLAVGIGVGASLSWGWGLAAAGAIVLATLLIPAKIDKPKGKSE